MIFISAPFSDPSPIIMAERARKAGRVMAELAHQGTLSIAPTFYGHELERRLNIHLPYDFWLEWGLSLLARCSKVYVLTIPGWEKSLGVQTECARAAQLNYPILGYSSEGVGGDPDVSGLDIRKHFGLPLMKAEHMRKV